jgi:uncharacterized RDD family membrane protein YckC
MSTGDAPEHASTIPAEARTHQGHPAGVVTRLLAAALDFVLMWCLLLVFYVGWTMFLFVLQQRSFSVPRPSLAFVVATYLVVAISCLAIPWSVNGRSYGQHVMGLRVTTRDGERLSFLRSLLRAAVCVCFPVSLLWAVVSRRQAAVHDLLLRTVVQYDWSTWR